MGAAAQPSAASAPAAVHSGPPGTAPGPAWVGRAGALSLAGRGESGWVLLLLADPMGKPALVLPTPPPAGGGRLGRGF